MAFSDGIELLVPGAGVACGHTTTTPRRPRARPDHARTRCSSPPRPAGNPRCGAHSLPSTSRWRTGRRYPHGPHPVPEVGGAVQDRDATSVAGPPARPTGAAQGAPRSRGARIAPVVVGSTGGLVHHCGARHTSCAVGTTARGETARPARPHAGVAPHGTVTRRATAGVHYICRAAVGARTPFPPRHTAIRLPVTPRTRCRGWSSVDHANEEVRAEGGTPTSVVGCGDSTTD